LEALGIAAITELIRSVLNLELAFDPSGGRHLQVVSGASWQAFEARFAARWRYHRAIQTWSADNHRSKANVIQHLADALGLKQPKVALLSAMETVNPKVPSTLDAAALCKMAQRGQIKLDGRLIDGPLALDNAINLDAVKIKKIDSPVAGRADVLVVPDLEAGNMLAKSLSFMAEADAAGIVLGARVPVILTSRADSVTARLASCAVAALVAKARVETAARAVA
jgi:phosphate acetyltransferase